jgi:uncharacterized protein (TIGR03066 family)
MRLLRVSLAGLLALGLAAGLRADDKKDDKKADNYAEKAVGNWEVSKGESLPAGSTLELTKAGKFTLVVKGQEVRIEGTYKITGDSITIKTKAPDGGEQQETMKIAKLTDDEFVTVDNLKKTDTFRRKK